MATATRTERLAAHLAAPVDGASLAATRVLLGVLVSAFVLRLLSKGFVEEAFVAPHTFFPLWPFGVVLRPLPPPGMHAVYGVMIALGLALALGVRTRLVAAVLAGLFTWAHFLDLTHYLNHYWLVSWLLLWMSVLPVSRTLALDARGAPGPWVPRWTVWALRFQIGVVYAFAGLTKLRHDWLVMGEPMRTWLLANTDVALIGSLFRLPWVPRAASWVGAAYDLTIVLWLCLPRTRPFAYAVVVVFHAMTARLFHIGLFPYVMVAMTLVFFPPHWPRRFVGGSAGEGGAPTPVPWAWLAPVVALHLLLPLRARLYPGNVLWHEQGYRFGWNVMLMEKMGSAEVWTIDRANGQRREVRVRDHLTHQQEKAMSTQPDLMLAFAHHLREEARREGRDVEVHADVRVTLNGRRPAPIVDSTVDLGAEVEGVGDKRWILPAPQ